MQYYYEIEEAWKLYVEQGVVKAESLNPSLLRLWELSKIAGAKYNKKSLSLTASPSFLPKQSFSLDLEHYSYTNYLALYLVDGKNFVHDVCGLGIPNINIPIGSRLNIENIGYTALHLSREEGGVVYLNYSENYIKALQSYETYAQPLELGGEEYHILVLSLKSGLKERLGTEFSALLEEFVDQTSKVDDLDVYKRRDFLHLFEISVEGIILNRLANTGMNKFFDEGMDLKQNYLMLNLDEILKGEKQFIASKSDKTKKFLLSPIKWNSANSILCQAEELESSYRAFSNLYRYATETLYFEAVPVELERRLRALFLSTYPSIIHYRRKKDLSFIIGLISSYRQEERLIISYKNGREVVNELCISKEGRAIHSHDFKAVAYHIIVEELGDSSIDELANLVEEALKGKEKPYSLLFYLKEELASNLASKLRAKANLLEMQTLDFSSKGLSSLIDNYYGASDQYSHSSEDEGGDLLALDREERAPSHRNKAKQRTENATQKPSSSFCIKDLEKQALIDALTASNYNISEASRKLGISRASLYRKMKSYDIHSTK